VQPALSVIAVVIGGVGEELTTGDVLTDCLALRLRIDMLDSVNDVLVMIVAALARMELVHTGKL